MDGRPVPASLFDFALYLYHNGPELVRRGSGPYFYLPKLESHLEARLWNEVFIEAQRLVGLPQGTIRATVLIETVVAAFEMDEILYELRPHAAGLNAGRWDYIFSVIKKFGHRPEFVLPDRCAGHHGGAFMRAYTEQLWSHLPRRGARHRRMAAFIPSRRDEEVTDRAHARPGGQGARSRPGVRRRVGGPSRPGPVWWRRCSARGSAIRNQKDRPLPGPVDTASLIDVRVPGGRVTDAGDPRQRERRPPVPGGLAARRGRGGRSTI